MALVKNINCREAVTLIGDYIDGRLPRRERRRLEKHLSVCDACTGYLEQMRDTIALTGRVEPEDLSVEALDVLMELFDNYRQDRDKGS